MNAQDKERIDAFVLTGIELMLTVKDREQSWRDEPDDSSEIADGLINGLLCIVGQLEFVAQKSETFRQLARHSDEWPTRVSAFKNDWGVDPDYPACLGFGEDCPFRVLPAGRKGWRRDSPIFAPVMVNAERIERERASGELQISLLRRDNPASLDAWTGEIVRRITRDEKWAENDVFAEVKKAAQDQIDAEERKRDSGAVLKTRLRQRVKRALYQIAR